MPGRARSRFRRSWPALTADLAGAGRSLTVEPVPFEGRPAEFLGGVGEFSVQASVMPTTIRVGQEFIYRIGLTGPGRLGNDLTS